MTNLEKYKLCVWACRRVKWFKCRTHRHHVRPKSLYPELADDESNVVEVPEIAHWALHEWLFAHYAETGNQAAVQKMKHVDLAEFINNGRPGRAYDFSRGGEILDAVHEKVLDFANAYFKHEEAAGELERIKAETRGKGDKKSVAETRRPFREREKLAAEGYRIAKAQLAKLNDVIYAVFPAPDELEEYDDKDVMLEILVEKLPEISEP